MMYLVTAEEMKEYDNNTIEKIGIPALVLMERAALAVRDVILKECPEGAVLIVAGIGNNGADGLALARLLAENGYQVRVCTIGNLEKATSQWKTQRDILDYYSVEVFAYEEKETIAGKYNVVVDAVFGIGLTRDVTGIYAKLLGDINDLSGRKIAVDIPSGLSATEGKVLGVAFCADITVTFGFGKLGMYLYPGADYCGNIIIADIGITEKAFMDQKPVFYTYDTLKSNMDKNLNTLLPVRRKDGNKGTFGKVLVIAGFEQMAGAAILCARAVLETGAGMVKVICEKENRSVLQSAVPEAMYGSAEELLSCLQWADVVVVGPGLGKSMQTRELLCKLLESTTLPLVLDADALNMISEQKELKELLRSYSGGKIMTPHAGELARLAGLSVTQVKTQFIEVAKKLAEEYHSVMVCKDARTMVTGEKYCSYLNITGNNGMATAGSGDVLAGIIGGLLAQGTDIFKAAVLGVYLHGLAGDTARDHYTEYGVTAGRILESIRLCLKV